MVLSILLIIFDLKISIACLPKKKLVSHDNNIIVMKVTNLGLVLLMIDRFALRSTYERNYCIKNSKRHVSIAG